MRLLSDLWNEVTVKRESSSTTLVISDNDMVILVVGPTGSGKSWFIKEATGSELAGYRTLPTKLQVIRCDLTDEARKDLQNDGIKSVIFIDTPSFLGRDNIDAHKEIRTLAGWIKWRPQYLGIIYMHRIETDPASEPVRDHLKELAIVPWIRDTHHPLRLHVVMSRDRTSGIISDSKIAKHEASLRTQIASLSRSKWYPSMHQVHFEGEPEVAWRAVEELFRWDILDQEEPQCRTSTVWPDIPPPPDLIPHISKGGRPNREVTLLSHIPPPPDLIPYISDSGRPNREVTLWSHIPPPPDLIPYISKSGRPNRESTLWSGIPPPPDLIPYISDSGRPNREVTLWSHIPPPPDLIPYISESGGPNQESTLWSHIPPPLGLIPYISKSGRPSRESTLWSGIPPPLDLTPYISESGRPNKEESQCKVSTLWSDIPSPPDLTPYISKGQAQHVAGGCFGDVYRCWYTANGSLIEVAVKAFRFNFATDVNDRSMKMQHRELGVWRRLNHENIVPFLGIAHGFGMCGALSLVSLWMPNGSLHGFLQKYDHNLVLGHRLKFLLDIANGLQFLHSFPIVHGDLTSANVLLDTDYTARLADFGFASLVGNLPEAMAYLQRSTTRPGALRWAAPEQVNNSDGTFTLTLKSDIYSFGCIALQVLSGKQPWSEVREDLAIIFRLGSGQKPGRPESRAMDDLHWNFIQECWSSITKRPTADVIFFSIQRFLNSCPRSPPVGDSLA